MSTWYFVTPIALDRHAGETTRVFEMVRGLAYYADVVVFAPLGEGAAPAWPGNVRITDVPLPTRPPRGLGFQMGLERALRREPVPDVFYAHAGSFHTPSLGYARDHKIPALVELYDLASLAYPLTHPASGGLARALTDLRAALYRRAEQRDYGQLATAIVPATAQLADLVARRYGVAPERIILGPNGANPEVFRPGPPPEARARLGLTPLGPLVGYVGSLTARHGVDTLLRGFRLALNERDDLTLVIVGSGPEEHRLVSMARLQEMGQRVIWTGWQPRERVRDYIQACDVLTAPYAADEYSRTFGVPAIKLGEYMAGGRPILASALAGLDHVPGEGIGRLFIPGDPDDLARRLLALLADPFELAQMGARARRLVEAGGYSWRALAWKLIAFLHDRGLGG